MIRKAKWAIKEVHLRIKYMTSKTCIFCKILNREMKSNILFENVQAFAIADINPVAKIHILIIPKAHIESVETLEKKDGALLVGMFNVAKKLVSKNKLGSYRLSFNGGKFQHVPHLHMHLLAGSKIEWSKL